MCSWKKKMPFREDVNHGHRQGTPEGEYRRVATGLRPQEIQLPRALRPLLVKETVIHKPCLRPHGRGPTLVVPGR